MHGNAWEWCQDCFGEYSRGDQVDPEGPARGSNRVRRGGSWLFGPGACRSAVHSWFGPGSRFSETGCRLAAVLPSVVAGGTGGLSTSAIPGPESFQPGETWVGSWTLEQPNLHGEVWPYVLTVTERSGDRFGAAATLIDLGMREIHTSLSGTIHGKSINATEVGPDAYKVSIAGDLSGREIQWKFEGTGTLGKAHFGNGKLTYQGPMELRPAGKGSPVAQEETGRLKLIGRWDHMLPSNGHRDVVLMADGTARMGGWRGTWTLEGSRLTLRWPSAGAPGQAWVDELDLNSDRTTYTGANRQGLALTGRRVGGGGYAGMPKVTYTPESELKVDDPTRVRPAPSLETWTNSLGMKFVRIEPGKFMMGSTEIANEKPPHLVEITRPFSLGDREVTQRQYQAVMGVNPSHFKVSDDLPVEMVSWLKAVTFCNELSQKEGRTPCYRVDGEKVTVVAGNGYRLPTEAEWEYACRAGSTSRFPFGDNEADVGEFAWNRGNSTSKTHPVGQKRPNRWGLYDMLGNVWEWCQDGYDGGYYTTSPPADPPGPSGAASRVFRGGSWYDGPWLCRPAIRIRYTPVGRIDNLGFRVAAVQS